MVDREYDYIRGNTVTAPNRRYDEIDKRKKIESEEKLRRERNKKIEDARKSRMKSIVQVSILVCILGVALVGRNGKIYEMQKDLISYKAEIKSALAESEALRVEQLKNSSPENIRAASKGLNMKTPDKNSIITIDNSKNHFGNIEQKVQGSEEEKSIFSKIKDLF